MTHWYSTHWYGTDESSVITTPTITWTDAADGTGGTVTIAGSYASSTNTIYTQTFTGAVGTASWATEGSRTGNGVVTATLTAGHYLIYCQSTYGDESASSTIHYIQVTDGTESVEYQCLVAVQARIAALTLTGIDAGDVVVREVPTERNVTLPGIIVSPQRSVHPIREGTNTRDDVTYGIYVAVFAADNQALTTNTAKYTKWIQQIAKALRNQRLSAVTESVICTVEPVATIPWGEWTNNLFAGGLLVKCTCRETRGLS